MKSVNARSAHCTASRNVIYFDRQLIVQILFFFPCGVTVDKNYLPSYLLQIIEKINGDKIYFGEFIQCNLVLFITSVIFLCKAIFVKINPSLLLALQT